MTKYALGAVQPSDCTVHSYALFAGLNFYPVSCIILDIERVITDMFTGFPEETIRFFLELRFHNDAGFFESHRADYEAYARRVRRWI